MALDRDSSIPLYQQVAGILRQRIEAGEYPPGTRLPNEDTLRRRYGTSRVTIRTAVQLLADEGLVETHHGKGTYVRNDVVTMEMGALQGFYGALRRSGAAVTAELLTCDLVPASRAVAQLLHIETQTEIRRLQRLYRVNQRPMALTTSYLWTNLTLEFSQAASTTVYGLLAARISGPLQEARWTVAAEAASARQATALDVSAGFPLLVLSRTTLSSDGVPREHTVHHVVSSLYQLYVSVHRDERPLEEDFLIRT